MNKGGAARGFCGMRAPDSTRHQPSLEVQIVASRQVVLFVGAAGSGTGSRNEGSMRSHQLACALLDGFEKQLGLTSQCRGQGVGRSRTAACSEGSSGSCRTLDDDTLPGSELTTELRFGGASPDCLEVVGVRARAVSISPPWGSCETMGAHLPLKSISDKTRVGRGQKGASRRPQ